MNGAPVIFAKRRAISVFPTPVGPIIKIFFGATSCRISSDSCCRRQRFRIAIATARLASPCPTIYRSSSVTTRFGVSDSGEIEAAASPLSTRPDISTPRPRCWCWYRYRVLPQSSATASQSRLPQEWSVLSELSRRRWHNSLQSRYPKFHQSAK